MANQDIFFKYRLQNKLRIPPGGKTNDIFNLEVYEKDLQIQEDMETSSKGDKTIAVDPIPKSSDCQISFGGGKKTTPPIITGKENVDLSGTKILKGAEAVPDLHPRNPITGEGCEISNQRIEAMDQAFVKKNSKRQPPGGKSSIIL